MNSRPKPRSFWAALFLWLVAGSSFAATNDNAPYDFAATFIRTLSALESIRDAAERDMQVEDANQHLAGCVRNMESFQLELNADIPALKAITLSGRAKGVPQQFAEFFELKRDLYKQMGDYCAQMIEGPKPGVDYGALAATAPKITARLDYIDNAIFKATPLVFGSLIGFKPDAQGHMSHLSITKAQMDSLAKSIKSGFGKKLLAKDQNYSVSAASVLYSYLEEEGFKGSDQP